MVLNLRTGGSVRVKTGQIWDKDISCKTNVLAYFVYKDPTSGKHLGFYMKLCKRNNGVKESKYSGCELRERME